jgi:hypothetical protein
LAHSIAAAEHLRTDEPDLLMNGSIPGVTVVEVNLSASHAGKSKIMHIPKTKQKEH